MDDVCEGKDFSFPEQEERVLELWAKLDAFHEQLRRTEGGEEFVFYDGPPFATGLPHYGHILAGTIKDVVTRHQSMRGRHVSRRFGWDCHGLPVEFEIDKLLGITNRQQVFDLGIGKYNETCRSIVTKYVSEWEAMVTRTGRWIDFKNDYKTMDLNFMESVWWVFAQLWEKDLVYKGFKVMPYSTGCKTALSNFEAALDYRVRDKSNGKVYVIAESRLGQLPVKAKASGKKQAPSKGSNAEAAQDGLDKESYELLVKIPGPYLVGLKYTPLFDFFIELQETAFRVIADNYVTDDSGTGVVHCAPAFGEDDHRVCLAAGIFEPEEICCRFVKVEKIKDQLLECNKETYWVPDYVKEKRFHNWLEGARDWAISRSRFWGTPLPLWMSQDRKEIVVMDSIEKLEKLSGVKVTDLHRHYVDDITIPSKRGPKFGTLKRVDDVFDCWFESGSMPYAYIHYPFENRELFEKNFPGNFVAEGLDQTRGWFYTLMVLSTALFGKPAFKNLICNGLVLAEDGKKMSKSKKNYPSPKDLIDEFGADSLRLYLVNSPVVRAESLRFKRTGVFAVVKDVFLPWYNAYRFFVQNAKRLEVEGLASFSPMEQAVVPYLVKYIDYLTNIYVRLNRKRFKGRTGEEDCRISLSTLYHVLVTTCVVMAPFTPFFTEVLYQNLRKVSSKSEESIHFCKFPSTTGERDERVEQSVNRMVTIIDLARNIRERHNKALKTPLKEMVVVHPDNDFLEDITGKLKEYVMEEINVKTVTPCNDPLMYASLRAEPNFSVLGKRLGKDMGKVSNVVKKMTQEQILDFEKSGEISFFGHCLKLDDIKVVRQFKRPENVSEKEIDAAGDGDVLVILDLRADQSLFEAGVAREVVNRIQKLRKTAQLEPADPVDVYYESVGSDKNTLEEILKSQDQYIRDALGSPIMPKEMAPTDDVILGEESHNVHDMSFVICIARSTPILAPDLLSHASGVESISSVKVSFQIEEPVPSWKGHDYS
ncbi:Isoleucine--tRNA ligase, cytoplasmic [Zea mays]|uniref:isoleucine--tRNA ligase n=2 Tax=Zea mays TaxID=4577 RepID=A0A3L6EEQ2_MAIZE|nr:Isoleucine--tRNA ligase cytoplasmic [Zea mays]PWZ18521.1 Isoleucine--tRNA ligase, cytoplasmic [Zea mays]